MSTVAGIERPRKGRRIAGVCAAVGRAAGVDPTAIRLVALALAVLGAGIPLYIVAWAVLPSDETISLGLRPERPLRALAVLVVVAVLGAGASFLILDGIHDALPISPDGRFGAALFLIILGLGALWWREFAPLRSDGVTPPPPVVAEPRPATPEQPVALPASPPQRGSLVYAPLVLLIALLVGAIPFLFSDSNTGDLTWDKGLAAALVVIGVGLVLGAFIRRGAWLIPMGALLSLALVILAIAGADFRGGAGERLIAPQTAAALPEEFRLAAGEAELDLRRLDLKGQRRTLKARVGAGLLVVRLPRTAKTELVGEVGFGEITVVPGDRSGVVTLGDNQRARRGAQNTVAANGGVDVTTEVSLPGNNGVLVIEADVGFGEMEVTW